VLALVLEHQLQQLGGHPLERREDALPYLGQVGEGRVPAQVGKVAAVRPRSLEGVVDVHQVRAQELEAGAAVAEPQILVRRDVPEVPHQRAHQRVVHPVQVGLVHQRHERERALAGLA
jgi:hypothetical protein